MTPKKLYLVLSHTDNDEQFFDFVVPVYEKRTIAEEEFATQVFDLDGEL